MQTGLWRATPLAAETETKLVGPDFDPKTGNPTTTKLMPFNSTSVVDSLMTPFRRQPTPLPFTASDRTSMTPSGGKTVRVFGDPCLLWHRRIESGFGEHECVSCESKGYKASERENTLHEHDKSMAPHQRNGKLERHRHCETAFATLHQQSPICCHMATAPQNSERLHRRWQLQVPTPGLSLQTKSVSIRNVQLRSNRVQVAPEHSLQQSPIEYEPTRESYAVARHTAIHGQCCRRLGQEWIGSRHFSQDDRALDTACCNALHTLRKCPRLSHERSGSTSTSAGLSTLPMDLCSDPATTAMCRQTHVHLQHLRVSRISVAWTTVSYNLGQPYQPESARAGKYQETSPQKHTACFVMFRFDVSVLCKIMNFIIVMRSSRAHCRIIC